MFQTLVLCLISFCSFVLAARVDGIPACGSGDYAVTELSLRSEFLTENGWTKDEENLDQEVRAFLPPDNLYTERPKNNDEDEDEYCTRICAASADRLEVADNYFKRPECRKTCESGNGCNVFARVQKTSVSVVTGGKCSCRVPVLKNLEITWSCGRCLVDETSREDQYNVTKNCKHDNEGIVRCCLTPVGKDKPPKKDEKEPRNQGPREEPDLLPGGDDPVALSHLCREFKCRDCDIKGQPDNYKCRENEDGVNVKCCKEGFQSNSECRSYSRCDPRTDRCPLDEMITEPEGKNEPTTEVDIDGTVKFCKNATHCRRYECDTADTDGARCSDIVPRKKDLLKTFVCNYGLVERGVFSCCRIGLGAASNSEKYCVRFKKSSSDPEPNDSWHCERNGIRDVRCERNGDSGKEVEQRRCSICNFSEKESDVFFASEGDNEKFQCRVTERERNFSDTEVGVKSREIECLSEKPTMEGQLRFCKYFRCADQVDKKSSDPEREGDLIRKCERNQDRTITCCTGSVNRRLCRTFDEPECKYSETNDTKLDMACQKVPPVGDCVGKRGEEVCCTAYGEKNEFVECKKANCAEISNQLVCRAEFSDGSNMIRKRKLEDSEAEDAKNRCRPENEGDAIKCDSVCRVNPLENTRDCFFTGCVRKEDGSSKCCKYDVDSEEEMSCKEFKKPERECVTKLVDDKNNSSCKNDNSLQERPLTKYEVNSSRPERVLIESKDNPDPKKPNLEDRIEHICEKNKQEAVFEILENGKNIGRKNRVNIIYDTIMYFFDSDNDNQIKPEEIVKEEDINMKEFEKPKLEDTKREQTKRTTITEIMSKDGSFKIRDFIGEQDTFVNEDEVPIRIFPLDRETIIDFVRNSDEREDTKLAIKVKFEIKDVDDIKDILIEEKDEEIVFKRSDDSFRFFWSFAKKAFAIYGYESRVEIDVIKSNSTFRYDSEKKQIVFWVVLIFDTTHGEIQFDPLVTVDGSVVESASDESQNSKSDVNTKSESESVVKTFVETNSDSNGNNFTQSFSKTESVSKSVENTIDEKTSVAPDSSSADENSGSEVLFVSTLLALFIVVLM